MSHRWTDDEALFEDVDKETAITRKGYLKLKGTILQACADGYEYLWDDTCCIDKSSSAELSEAINSMCVWYQDAATCYAYLCDVPSTENDPEFEDHFSSNGWFTRGWTLQELVAPRNVSFYNETWCLLGTRGSLHRSVSSITGIEAEVLDHTFPLSRASIAKRMPWAAKRQTTRCEDIAYSLMGMFSVNMAMLYGEGSRAFQRLQEEILKISDDESMFDWQCRDANPKEMHGLLAASPVHFLHSGNISPCVVLEGQEPLLTTNRGLRVQRSLVGGQLPLDCQHRDLAGYICISITPLHIGNQYARSHLAELRTCSRRSADDSETLYIPQVIPDSARFAPVEDRIFGLALRISSQLTQSNAYVRNYQKSGLHPLAQETMHELGVLAPHIVPKFGTHVELVLGFKRRVDNIHIYIMFGSLNATELGFAAGKGEAPLLEAMSAARGSIQTTTQGRETFYHSYVKAYTESVVPTGSLIDLDSRHRVSVTRADPRTRRNVHELAEVLLEIDIVALYDPQPLPSHASCCCIQRL